MERARVAVQFHRHPGIDQPPREVEVLVKEQIKVAEAVAQSVMAGRTA